MYGVAVTDMHYLSTIALLNCIFLFMAAYVLRLDSHFFGIPGELPIS